MKAPWAHRPMIRPRQMKLKLSKSQFQHCQQLSEESARIWNASKNFFWRTYRKKGIWLSESSMKRYIAGQFNLHSQSTQAVVEKFYDNLSSAHTLRKANPSIRYPYKNKSWFCVHWKKSAIKVKGRLIQFSNGKGRQGIVFKLPAYLVDCQPKCVELIWRNGYWLSLTLDFPVRRSRPLLFAQREHNKQLSFDTAAVDMGEIHAMTITDGREAIVISGRQLRSVKRNRNRRVAQLQRLQSRCKCAKPSRASGKDSRRWKRLQAVKSKVMASCHRRTRDLNHKITRIAVNWCTEHDVSKLVIGDVTGISKNTKSKKRVNRKNRQKISQWAFYQQRKYLEYKCDEVGIETTLEPENGTSKTCPKCGNKYRPTGRNYDCQNPECDLKMHRDVVGACNIRTKNLIGVLNGQPPTPFGKGDDNFKSPTVKYLRIDDQRSSKSSSGTGVARRKRRKSFRRRLGVPGQLTLLPPSSDGAIQSRMLGKA